MISTDRMTILSRNRGTGALRPISAVPSSTSNRLLNDDGEEIFLVGQLVSAGTYRQLDSARVITLEGTGPLPPSFDGRRAEYVRVERPWINITVPISQEKTY